MNVLITGIAGQDSFYLADLLKDVSVYGLYRSHDESRLTQLRRDMPHVTFLRGDITDPASVGGAVRDSQPDWVFNLAALSYVGLSWQMPHLYMETNCGGVLNVLNAVHQYAPKAHVIQASTSEMYGNNGTWANETTPMLPVSPYGVSKLAAHNLCRVYRESYELHVSCAISFNHESPRRPPNFVTRKVTQAAAKRANGEDVELRLGTLDTARDWGYARDYMEAYILMAEAEKPDDYVIGTGESHSIADLIRTAEEAAGVRLAATVDPVLSRPNELNYLKADASKIQSRLGWHPKTSFRTLIHMMVEADREGVLV